MILIQKLLSRSAFYWLVKNSSKTDNIYDTETIALFTGKTRSY